LNLKSAGDSKSAEGAGFIENTEFIGNIGNTGLVENGTTATDKAKACCSVTSVRKFGEWRPDSRPDLREVR
jgi:hypothetical protein